MSHAERQEDEMPLHFTPYILAQPKAQLLIEGKMARTGDPSTREAKAGESRIQVIVSQ